METDEDEDRPPTPFVVTISFRLLYDGAARNFNARDVVDLAREGIEAQYDVDSAFLLSVTEDYGGD